MENVVKHLTSEGIPYSVEDSPRRRCGKTSRSVMRALVAASAGNKVLYMSVHYRSSEHARAMALDLCTTLGWQIVNEKHKRRIIILDSIINREVGQVDFYDLNNSVARLGFTTGVIDQDH